MNNFIFIAIIIILIIIVTFIVLYFVLWEKEKYDCVSKQKCLEICGNGNYVLYSYWIYAIEKEPSMDNFNVIDIKTRLKNVVNSGYNIVNLSFYQYGSIDYVGSFGKLLWLKGSDRKEIIDYAHSLGVRLLVSIGGAVGTASFIGVDYKTIGDEINSIINENNLDGVDIDIENPSLFQMIADLTNYLGEKWKNKNKLITHAPQSANFQDNKGSGSDYFTVYKNCGDYIDFLNVQFYNQGCPHTSYDEIFVPYNYQCWNIAWISTGKDDKAKVYGSVIPLNKIIVGKPIENGVYGANNGYVDPNTLGDWFKQARNEINWNPGLMIWAFVPDTDKAKNYLETLRASYQS